MQLQFKKFMIKEKKKITKYNRTKTKKQVLIEYIRTIGVSFFIALLITFYLTIQARKDMVKNVYINASEKQKIEERIAKQLVAQSDLMKDLRTKSYAICMQVGHLYEVIHDYQNAQIAYELAIEKSKPQVYQAYAKLVDVLVAQEKFEEANSILDGIRDIKNKSLIKTKTRAYINMGDKYYSLGKFLSAAKSYEKAKFYYDKFAKKDKEIEKSIEVRITNAYIETAGVMVARGQNSDAVRFLKRAEKLAPNSFSIKYKLAIIYSDSDPLESVKYFDELLKERPQDIDSGTYGKALMKAANIEDAKGNFTQAKYYRYKIRSIDLFTNRKVVYKNDIEVMLLSFSVKKVWLKYKLKPVYKFANISNIDVINMSATFVLRNGEDEVERVDKNIVNRSYPLLSNGGETNEVEVVFGKNIFTKRELKQYEIDVYLYKDEKYKTLVNTIKVPLKSVNYKPVEMSHLYY